MGLLLSVAVIAVIVIAVAAIAFLVFTTAAVNPLLTVANAKSLVVNDIKTQSPNANVTIISVSNSTHAASWLITLSIIYNGSKPCPTVLIEQFDYPATGLHPTNDTQASGFNSGVCSVYIHGSLPPYAPLFIASSYASKNPYLISYTTEFGYGNTFVTATPSQDETNSSLFGNQTNVWLVRYKATTANYSISAVLDQSGKVMQTYNAPG
jgi:hypothetical protein